MVEMHWLHDRTGFEWLYYHEGEDNGLSPRAVGYVKAQHVPEQYSPVYISHTNYGGVSDKSFKTIDEAKKYLEVTTRLTFS